MRGWEWSVVAGCDYIYVYTLIHTKALPICNVCTYNNHSIIPLLSIVCTHTQLNTTQYIGAGRLVSRPDGHVGGGDPGQGKRSG